MEYNMKKIYIQPDIEIVETELECLCTGSSGDGIAWDEEMGDGSGSMNDEESDIDALSKGHNNVWDEW